MKKKKNDRDNKHFNPSNPCAGRGYAILGDRQPVHNPCTTRAHAEIIPLSKHEYAIHPNIFPSIGFSSSSIDQPPHDAGDLGLLRGCELRPRGLNTP